jgi:aspartyl-tRNA synthetase
MKTLKNFITEHKVIKEEPVVEQENEVLELQLEDIDFISEEDRQNHTQPHDPPAVLIMRRKAIRTFPNGQRVGLYHIDKLNKYVTVPYESLQWSSMPEETQIEESVMHHLKHIVDNHSAKAVKFKDGKTMKVDVQTAQAVLKVHGALNDENKKKVEHMANKSKQHFGKVVDFAWKHVQ